MLSIRVMIIVNATANVIRVVNASYGFILYKSCTRQPPFYNFPSGLIIVPMTLSTLPLDNKICFCQHPICIGLFTPKRTKMCLFQPFQSLDMKIFAIAFPHPSRSTVLIQYAHGISYQAYRALMF